MIILHKFAFVTFNFNRIDFFCFSFSLGPLETLPREMVSRRKILSRSRDDLNLEQQYQQQDDEEDIWYQKEKLYKVSLIIIKNRISFNFNVNERITHNM